MTEALQAGKKILVKPLQGQFEQTSNALALEKLGLGTTMRQLSPDPIGEWLSADRSVQVIYPDTAQLIVDRLRSGERHFDPEWISGVWNRASWPEGFSPDIKKAA